MIGFGYYFLKSVNCDDWYKQTNNYKGKLYLKTLSSGYNKVN